MCSGSWVKSGDRPAEEPARSAQAWGEPGRRERMPGIVEFPDIVLQAVDDLGDLFDNERARRHFAEYLTGLYVADSKILALRDQQTGKLEQEASRRSRRSRAREDVLRLSATMVNRVMEYGEPIIAEDAAQDFAAESVTRYRIGSVMCAPIRSRARCRSSAPPHPTARAAPSACPGSCRWPPAPRARHHREVAGFVQRGVERSKASRRLPARSHADRQALSSPAARRGGASPTRSTGPPPPS